MKIKKIAALCSRAGTFRLYNKMDREGVITQWLGTGNALYPLNGLPLLDEESLCAMFDIPEKKREKLVILCEDMPEIIDVADKDPKETLLEEKEMTIGYNGMQIIPLRTKDGIIFIGEQFLEPLADEIDLLNLYERKTPKGVSYVAVKAGMMLRGIIAPYDVVTDKKFITQLELLLIDSKRELEKITISSCSTADQDDGQQSIFEDADESKEG